MRLLFIVLLFISTNIVKSQITYTNASFPSVGDSIIINTTIDEGAILTPASSNAQSWDYAHLNSQFYTEEVVRSASNGAYASEFPDAELLMNLTRNFGVAYVDVGTSKVSHIGGGIELFGIGLISRYVNPRVILKAPLTYNDSGSDTYELHFGEHIDSVPGLRQIIDSITNGVISVDSIRFNFNGTEYYSVNAYGDLTLPNGNKHEVIRKKVTTYSNFDIELRIPPFIPQMPPIWVDLTTYMPLPIPTKDTIIHYDYLANEYKQPLLRMNMSNDGNTIETIDYIGVATTEEPEEIIEEFQLFPNPTRGVFKIKSPELLKTITIYNITSKKVISLSSINRQVLELNMNTFARGAYFLKIELESGEFVDYKLILTR